MIDDAEIERLRSRSVYANRWMNVREDDVRFPNGHEGIYGVVEKPDFVLIVPVHSDGRIQLVEQFRYPVGGRYWELPQGSWETRRDVDPVEVARAELAEETGYSAQTMEPVAHWFEAYGFCNQGFHVYRATELTAVDAKRDIEEAGMRTAAFPMTEIVHMIASGAIKDAPSIAAFGWLQMMPGAP